MGYDEADFKLKKVYIKSCLSRRETEKFSPDLCNFVPDQEL